MSISTNSEINLDNISNKDNSLVRSIRILSDITIKDVKKIEINKGVKEAYYSGSNERFINK